MRAVVLKLLVRSFKGKANLQGTAVLRYVR